MLTVYNLKAYNSQYDYILDEELAQIELLMKYNGVILSQVRIGYGEADANYIEFRSAYILKGEFSNLCEFADVAASLWSYAQLTYSADTMTYRFEYIIKS